MDEFKQDLERDFAAHAAAVDNVFFEISHRTEAFLTEHFQLSNLPGLVSRTSRCTLPTFHHL
jgi:hypothetical protein